MRSVKGCIGMQGIDPRWLEVLRRASSPELVQLSAVIERMLADPKRVLAVRKDLHLGQPVRFLDGRDGQMRAGTVVAMKVMRLTIREQASRRFLDSALYRSGAAATRWQTSPRAAIAIGAKGEPKRLPTRRNRGLRGQASEHHRALEPAHRRISGGLIF